MPAIGETIGSYQVLKQLGSGAMGESLSGPADEVDDPEGAIPVVASSTRMHI